MKKNTATGTLPTLKEVSPDALCIGNDLMLTDDYRVPDYMFEPFRTHSTVAVFFHYGEYEVSIQMKRYRFKAPCLLLILNDRTVQWHSADVLPKTTCVVMSRRALEGIVPDHGDSMALYQSILEDPVVPIEPDYKPMVDCHLAFLREIIRHSDNPNRLAAAQNLMHAFFLGMPQLKKTPHVPSSHKDELLFNFMELLRNNFRSERTTRFYASRLSISDKHLSKVVKQMSGRTVHDWIDEYVSTEAKALLRSTDMTVSQVASALNFASQPLFTKFFRRTTGLNPSDLRRRK